MARAPAENIFNWPFIGAFVVAALTALQANTVYMGLPVLLTAYGPDGAGVIAVLEAARASEKSTFRLAAQGRCSPRAVVLVPQTVEFVGTRTSLSSTSTRCAGE